MIRVAVIALCCGLAAAPFVLTQPNRDKPAAVKVGEARRDEDGFLSHPIDSELQSGPTEIKVLLPDRLAKGRRYPVLYVLPVEAGLGQQYGHGLRELKKLDLHNKHNLIGVLPTFARLPWYADHPTDARLRQEAYFVKVVLPLVERSYPVRAERDGRLLLGFSKSGWGAFSLLLRHPDLFGRAAAWDAPLNMDKPNRFGMGDIFGSQENFEKYQIARLLEARAAELRKESRLALVGHASFRDHHQAVHDLLTRLKVPHEYRDEKKPRHSWDAGWMEDAVRFLTAVAP